MTNQPRKYFAECGASTKLKPCAMLVLLTLALSVVSVAQSASDASQAKSTTDQAAGRL